MRNMGGTETTCMWNFSTLCHIDGGTGSGPKIFAFKALSCTATITEGMSLTTSTFMSFSHLILTNICK